MVMFPEIGLKKEQFATVLNTFVPVVGVGPSENKIVPEPSDKVYEFSHSYIPEL
jgi:hypothetical protein